MSHKDRMNRSSNIDWTMLPNLGSFKHDVVKENVRCIEFNITIPTREREIHFHSRQHISSVMFFDAPPRVKCGACGEDDILFDIAHDCEETKQSVCCRICNVLVDRTKWGKHVVSDEHFERLKILANETKHCDTCDVDVVSLLWEDHVKRFRHFK